MSQEVTFNTDTEFSVDHDSEGFRDYPDDDEYYKDLGGEDPGPDQPQTKRGDSSDEIDPRKLVRNPDLSEIRWYYNRTFANKLVDKPVEDAFKHGFELTGQNTNEVRDLFEETDYIEQYKTAKKKARRDGFALLFIGWKAGADNLSTGKIPQNVTGISHLKVLTVDDLAEHKKGMIDEQIPLERENYIVRESGIVINRNINSPNFNDPIGYVLNSSEPQFIHKSWVQHFVYNPEVDGDYDRDAIDTTLTRNMELGKWEGESLLTNCYDLLKWLKKANWAIGQTLFRYASKMYSVKVPKDTTGEEWDEANNALRNLNAKSEIILPSPEYEVDDYDTDGQLEPEEYFDILFEQICACSEMTKSVLFGTQQGTVTGSETDIKNYFNQVEKLRNNEVEGEFEEFVQMLSEVDTARNSQVLSNVAAGTFGMSWNPLFQMSEEDRVEAIRTSANALTMLINNYALTPDEARSILSEEWAEFEGLEDLDEDQRDLLDRITLAEVGAWKGAERAEKESGNQESMGNPREQNGGGRQQGGTSASNNPVADGSEEKFNGVTFKVVDE